MEACAGGFPTVLLIEDRKGSNLMSLDLGEEEMRYIHGNKYNAANKGLGKSHLYQYEYIYLKIKK